MPRNLTLLATAQVTHDMDDALRLQEMKETRAELRKRRMTMSAEWPKGLKRTVIRHDDDALDEAPAACYWCGPGVLATHTDSDGHDVCLGCSLDDRRGD